MAITTKNRKQLKSYFVKNAIPTEGNFADLIDGALNQAEDGVFKLAGEPLSVVAAPGEQKRVLRFYTNYPAPNADWLISLSPAQDPSNPATVRPGFGVTDGAGNTRLFIDPATGNVGVGTNNPTDRLTVTNGDILIEGGRYRRLKVVSDSYWAGIELVARGKGEAGYPHIDFTNGDLGNPNFGLRLVGIDNKTLQLEGMSSQATLSVKGDISLDGQLSRLDVKEQGVATIRAADLVFGHSSRHGAGRALVDLSEALVVNYGKDWPRTDIHSPLSVSGNVGVGTNDPKGALEVRVPGVGGWDRVVVNTTSAWGDGDTQYVTIGAGGATGIMCNNPHVPWLAAESRASIRYGRSGGVQGGAWWDVGVRANNVFSFNLNNSVNVLTLADNGQVTVPGNLEVGGTATLGWAQKLNNFNLPVRNGFYEFDNPIGRVPDTSHPWVHMIQVRHSNQGNFHALQIASSYGLNDRLFFRKIARDLTPATESWNELATVTNGVLKIGDWTISAEGNNLVIRKGAQPVARFSIDWDRFLVYKNLNGAAPYFFYNAGAAYGNHNG